MSIEEQIAELEAQKEARDAEKRRMERVGGWNVFWMRFKCLASVGIGVMIFLIVKGCRIG